MPAIASFVIVMIAMDCFCHVNTTLHAMLAAKISLPARFVRRALMKKSKCSEHDTSKK